MENHRKEEALQNKKRRKEQLNLKRGKKRVCTLEETTKMKYRPARLKRKEIIKEKRKPKRSETEKRGDAESNIWNFGKPKYRCEHCNALLWYEERLRPKVKTKKPAFGMCYKEEKNQTASTPKSTELPQQTFEWRRRKFEKL